jgi:hypothetical protein
MTCTILLMSLDSFDPSEGFARRPSILKSGTGQNSSSKQLCTAAMLQDGNSFHPRQCLLSGVISAMLEKCHSCGTIGKIDGQS